MVQALVKFDTLQSLSVYNKKSGKLLQSRGTKEEPARVIEYMVLEKRVQTETPWMIRNQLLEGVKAKYDELF
ncbi:hypothetical protein FRC03_000798 [Tulasnella sp. 419]|nr:hypothetical protein FRC03_000798 [Tulasnella sp. 419]